VVGPDISSAERLDSTTRVCSLDNKPNTYSQDLAVFKLRNRGFESRLRHGFLSTSSYFDLLMVGALQWSDPLSTKSYRLYEIHEPGWLSQSSE